MDDRSLRRCCAAVLAARFLFGAHISLAATAPDGGMAGMDMSAQPAGQQPMQPMQGMETMQGMFGPYSMSREASGTSWQPDTTPHQGIYSNLGDWMLMVHGYIDGVYDVQGGRRGETKGFSESMGMLMAQRAIGADGTLGLRAMVSLDPLMGPNGYPLLFATGETSDGHTPLIDRQHPHNLFMELAASYSEKLSQSSSVFLYAGLPGEPALGPPAFMHRFSGMDNPEAPITHHWLDSTHITNGVITAGVVVQDFKIESSVFNGREPDQNRYQINSPKLDSESVRLSWNPAPEWSLQASWGYLKSPEEITPGTQENRVTASASYTKRFAAGVWATTFAWGRKIENPGHTLDGFLLESAVVLHDRHTVFGRVERVNEDELFQSGPLAGQVVTPTEFTLGYIRDFPVVPHLKFGIGALVSRYLYPRRLDAAYGDDPTSFMLFARLKLG